MFAQPQQTGGRRWRLSHLVSFVTHSVVAFLLVKPPAPIFVKPESVLLGDLGNSTTIYLPSQALTQAQASRHPEQKLIYVPAPKQIAPHGKTKPRVKPHKKVQEVEVAENLPKAGTPYGTLFGDLMNGAAIRPALPMIFPDPPVARSEIPSGVQGSVIVEVTIDAQGNVIETRLIQGLGYGIEDKVIATLHNWRFRPATRDGIAIPSKQDVYFRFPS